MFARTLLALIGTWFFLTSPAWGQGTTKTLTIKGSVADDGATIEIPDSAEVSLVVNADGIVITMPNLDLRLRCLGTVTEDGYCYVAAAGASADTGGSPDPDPTTYTVTVSAGEGGSVTPTGDQTVAEGATLQVAVEADEGFNFASMSGDCPAGSTVGSRYTTGPITANCTLTAVFEAQDDIDTTAYCSGVPNDLKGIVVCDPDAAGEYRDPGGNLDVWVEGAGTFSQAELPEGKILALPFTANAAGYYGYINIGTNMGRLTDGFRVRFWFSAVPGGDELSGGTHCSRKTANPNPYSIKWSQEDGVGDAFVCDLGAEERTLYFNMEVACFDETDSTCTFGERFPRDYFLKLIHGTPSRL